MSGITTVSGRTAEGALEPAAPKKSAAGPTRPKRTAIWRVTPRSVLVLVLRIAVLVGALASWEYFVKTGALDELYLSRPTLIWDALINGISDGALLDPLWVTLYETLVGFGVAAVAGVVIALVLFQVPLLNDVARPFITALNSLPRLALAPLFVLWFGLGSASKIALVISLVVFIVLLNTYAGLQAAGRDHLLLAKTLGASRSARFRKFLFPSAVPSIFAGLQLALTYSFLAAVIGEMLSGSTGLGAVLQRSLSTYQTAVFFACLVLLVITSVLLSSAMSLLERRLLAWQRFEMRGLRG